MNKNTWFRTLLVVIGLNLLLACSVISSVASYSVTDQQIEQVLSIPDISTSHGLRNRAILEVLYSTGIRRNELVHIKVNDINFNKGTVFIGEGKGKRDRVVPIGARALLWVERYLYGVRPSFLGLEVNEYLFLGERGRELQQEQLGQIVKRCLILAGHDKPGLCCHLFRHTMATSMLENDADIRHIQSMLGHRDITSTQIYTHVAIGKLKEVHSKCHPAKLKEKKVVA